jgi:hypothetical protein
MWLVAKGAKNAKGMAPISAALSTTLRIWYTGHGDHRDEQAALLLVRHARRNGQWIACDCQGDECAPMLSPALLTGADTYYLRRLSGGGRPQHQIECPFFREQSFNNIPSEKRPTRNLPGGYFSVLRPPAISLAQEPEDDTLPRDSASHGVPRLAKLMWRLLELSGRTRIEAQEDAPRDIAGEFAAVRLMAEQTEVAPGIPLSRVLFTHPKDWESRRIFAVLRELAKTWPKGHEPQAFLLVFARRVHEHSIETTEGVIDLATRLRHPGTRDDPIDGPDLTLVAIGERPDANGYGALRAWGQPVHNGHRFIPVDSNFDRDVVETIIAARRILAGKNIALSATKPLFDSITPDGAVRPCWTITMEQGQRTLTTILESDAQDDEVGHRRRALGFIGSIIDIDKTTLPYLTASLTQLWDKQMASQKLPS